MYCFLIVFGHPVAQANEAKHQTCHQTSEYSGASATVTVPSNCKILPSFCLVSRMFWLIEEGSHYREWLEEDEQIFLCGVLSLSLPIQRFNVSDFHGNIAICALDRRQCITSKQDSGYTSNILKQHVIFWWNDIFGAATILRYWTKASSCNV